jgi:hypothetical protein
MILRAAALALLVCVALAADESALPDSNGKDSMSAEYQPETPAPAVCPAGGPVGVVQLQVASADSKGQPLPLRTINHLGEGDTVLYSPVIRGKEKRIGEIALVMVRKKHNGTDPLIVTDPVPADRPQKWKISEAVSIVVYVYGPSGLNKKKVQGFLSQDDLLIAQLADYAEKTAQTEALIEALSSTDTSSASVNAALSGFASQYGVASLQIDKAAPTSVQAATLFNSLNPQLASYDPLTPSTSARIGQTASLTTAVGALFFGSPIGLAAGGTAMLLDLRSIAFPGTQFRSSFAQPLPNGLNLCGQRTPAPPHTRVAYLWANRIPNAPTPSLEIGKADFIPPALKTVVPTSAPDGTWRYLERARDWTLLDRSNHSYPLKITKLANQKSLELDLTKTQLPVGDYRLSGFWDWQQFQASGTINVRNLADFANADPDPVSQDRLLAKSGKTVLTLKTKSDDFEFVEKVDIKKIGDEFATPQPVPFLLPKGVRQGPQNRMDVQIDTKELDPGPYQLLITQPDGKPHPIGIHILPNPPNVTNLPVLANQGEAQQHYVLQGERLDQITSLQTQGAEISLAPSGSDPSQRSITVQLKTNLTPGTVLPLSAHIANRNEPLDFPKGLRITGPLPTIASSKLSLPSDLGITLQPGEIPAGTTLTAVLDVKNADPASMLRIACGGDTQLTEIRIGSQTDRHSLQQLSPDQLFLSFDTSALPTGCLVQATIANPSGGESAPFTLAHVLRIPAIEQFAPAADPVDGKRLYQLTGRNLEMIERAGWDQLAPIDVQDLPTPIPGQGQKQSLRISLADPPQPPTACLYIWLRGDKLGRATPLTPAAAPVLPGPDGH